MSELLLLAAIAQTGFGKINSVKGFSPCWVSLNSNTVDYSEVSSFVSVTESGISFMQMLLCISNSSALIQFPQLPKCSLFSYMWSQLTFLLPYFLKDFKHTLHFLSDFFCFGLQTFLCLIKFSFLLNVFEHLLKDISLLQCVFSYVC